MLTKQKICAVYGEDAVIERMCQRWFEKFRAGDTTLEYEKRSDRPAVADEKIKNFIKINQRYTTREIAEKLYLSDNRHQAFA